MKAFTKFLVGLLFGLLLGNCFLVVFGQYVPVPFTHVSAPAGISFVSAQAQQVASGANALTFTWTAGDTAIIGVSVESATATDVVTPVSSGSETVSLIGSKQLQAFDGGTTMAIYKVASMSGGSESITETAGSSKRSNLVILQMRGSSAGAIDGTTIANNGNFSLDTTICSPGTGGSACTSNFTPTVSGEATIYFVVDENFNTSTGVAGLICGATSTIPSGGKTTSANTNLIGEYLLNVGTSACTAAMTISPSDRTQALGVFLKP